MPSDTARVKPGTRHLPRELVIALLTLAAAGLIAISVSGALALVFGQIAGKEFVAGDGSAVTYTDERCAVFLEHAPDAGSCGAAATEYNFDKLVSNRVSIGIVGVLAFGVAWLLQRRRKPVDIPVLPRNLVSTVASVIFSIVAFGLLAFSLMQLIYAGSDGIGADLAGGIVCAIAFIVAQRRSGRSLVSYVRPEPEDD